MSFITKILGKLPAVGSTIWRTATFILLGLWIAALVTSSIKGWRLGNAIEDKATAVVTNETNVQQCADTNDNNTAELEAALSDLAACVNLNKAPPQKDYALENRLLQDQLKAEREKAYEQANKSPSCIEWESMPVCSVDD